MTYEHIYDIWFTDKKRFKLSTLRNYVKKGYMPDPDTHTDIEMNDWAYSFIGKLVRKKNGDNIANKCIEYLGYVPDYEGWTDSIMDGLSDFVKPQVAPNTFQLYMRMIATVLNSVSDREDINLACKSYKKHLKKKGSKSDAIYLTEQEIKLIREYEPEDEQEEFVKRLFLISAYTGCRHSDSSRLDTSYITGGRLVYTSEKTKIRAEVPCGEYVKSLLGMQVEGKDNSRDVNRTLRDICRKVGINEVVSVFRKGKTERGEKWQFVTFHTSRRSFCTNLAERGVSLISIRNMAGHTNTAQTERYVKSRVVDVSGNEDFFE